MIHEAKTRGLRKVAAAVAVGCLAGAAVVYVVRRLRAVEHQLLDQDLRIAVCEGRLDSDAGQIRRIVAVLERVAQEV